MYGRSLDPECVVFWAQSRLVTWWLLVKGYNPRGLDQEFSPSFTSVTYLCLPQANLSSLSQMAFPFSSVNNGSQANSATKDMWAMTHAGSPVTPTPVPANPDGCCQHCRRVHSQWAMRRFQWANTVESPLLRVIVVSARVGEWRGWVAGCAVTRGRRREESAEGSKE